MALVDDLKRHATELEITISNAIAEIQAAADKAKLLAGEDLNGSRSWWLARESALRFAVDRLRAEQERPLL